jgi:hypothetical protein
VNESKTCEIRVRVNVASESFEIEADVPSDIGPGEAGIVLRAAASMGQAVERAVHAARAAAVRRERGE